MKEVGLLRYISTKPKACVCLCVDECMCELGLGVMANIYDIFSIISLGKYSVEYPDDGV